MLDALGMGFGSGECQEGSLRYLPFFSPRVFNLCQVLWQPESENGKLSIYGPGTI